LSYHEHGELALYMLNSGRGDCKISLDDIIVVSVSTVGRMYNRLPVSRHSLWSSQPCPNNVQSKRAELQKRKGSVDWRSRDFQKGRRPEIMEKFRMIDGGRRQACCTGHTEDSPRGSTYLSGPCFLLFKLDERCAWLRWLLVEYDDGTGRGTNRRGEGLIME